MGVYGNQQDHQLNPTNESISNLLSSLLIQTPITRGQDELLDDDRLSSSFYQDINNNAADNHNEQPLESSTTLSFLIISAILSTIVVCTFVGNLFVIVAIFMDKNLQTSANQLVLSLAVADLMVACLVMPLGAYNDIHQGWYLGKEICEFWTSADVLCCTASILNLLAIAIDRYKAVTNVDYIYKRTRRRVNVMILCAWTVGAIVSLAPIFGWKDPDFAHRVVVEHKCLVSQDVAYQIFATISTFYAPLVLLLALYWRIFQVARKRIRNKPGGKSAPLVASAGPPVAVSGAPPPGTNPSTGAAIDRSIHMEPIDVVAAAAATHSDHLTGTNSRAAIIKTDKLARRTAAGASEVPLLVNNNNNCDQFDGVQRAGRGRGSVAAQPVRTDLEGHKEAGEGGQCSSSQRLQRPATPKSVKLTSSLQHHQLSSPAQQLSSPSRQITAVTSGLGYVANNQRPSCEVGRIISTTGGRAVISSNVLTRFGSKEDNDDVFGSKSTTIEWNLCGVDDGDGDGDNDGHHHHDKQRSIRPSNWRASDIENDEAGIPGRAKMCSGGAAGAARQVGRPNPNTSPNGEPRGRNQTYAGCFHCSSAGSSSSSSSSSSSVSSSTSAGSASSLSSAHLGTTKAAPPPQGEPNEVAAKCHCCCCLEGQAENDEDEPSCSISASQLIKCNRRSSRQQEPRQGGRRPDYSPPPELATLKRRHNERDNEGASLLSGGGGGRRRRRRFSESPSSSTLAEADVVGRTIGELQQQQQQQQPPSSLDSLNCPQPPSEFQDDDHHRDCHSRPPSAPNHDGDKTTSGFAGGVRGGGPGGTPKAANNILTVNNNINVGGNLFDCELSIQSSEKANEPTELALSVLRLGQTPADCQQCPSSGRPVCGSQTTTTTTTTTTATDGEPRKELNSTLRTNSGKLKRVLVGDEGGQFESSRSVYLRRKFRALGQLVSFVQTSRQFNSSSSAPTSQSGNEHDDNDDDGADQNHCENKEQVKNNGALASLPDESLQVVETKPSTTTTTTTSCERNSTAIDMNSSSKPSTMTTTTGATLASTTTDSQKPTRSPATQTQRRTINRENLDIKREKKAAKTLAIITGVFVCCWLPFFLNAIVMPICGPACTPSDLILSVLLWLGYLNSLLNPIIYTIFSPDFRRAFNRLLSCLSWASPGGAPASSAKRRRDPNGQLVGGVRSGQGRRVWPSGPSEQRLPGEK